MAHGRTWWQARTAVRTNLHAYLGAHGTGSSSEFRSGARASWWATPLPHSWFNGVASGPLDPRERDALLDPFLRALTRQGQHRFTWWPVDDPAPGEQVAALRALGLRRVEGPPGMALPLEALPAVPRIVGARYRRLRVPEEMDVWARVYVAGYGLPGGVRARVRAVNGEADWGTRGRFYLAELDGEPVATSMLFLDGPPVGGSAGIYDVATVAHARRRGLASLLTIAPLLEARTEGYALGVLQTSVQGRSVYESLGFRHTGPVEHFEGDLTAGSRWPGDSP